MHGDFEILGWKHLAGSNEQPELYLELRERLRPVVLGLIVVKSYLELMQKSLSHSFEPLICWQGSQGTISAL